MKHIASLLLPAVGVFLGACLCLPGRLMAAPCSEFSGIQHKAVVTVNETVEFNLACAIPMGALADSAATVLWKMRADSGDPINAQGSRFTYKWSEPGHYFFTARIQNAYGTHVLSSNLTVRRPLLSGRGVNSSSIYADVKSKSLWILNKDNHSLSVIRTSDFKKIKEMDICREPHSITGSSKSQIWVSCQGSSKIVEINATSFQMSKQIELPFASQPMGLVFDSLRNSLYVALNATGKVAEINANTGALVKSISVFPTPSGLGISQDKASLYVTRLISPQHRAEIAKISLPGFSSLKIIALEPSMEPDDETGGRGILNAMQSMAFSPDGFEIALPALKNNVFRGLQRDGQAMSFESTVRTAVAFLNEKTDQEVPSRRTDLDNRSFARYAQYTSMGDYLFIAAQGSNDIVVLDAYTHLDVTTIEPDSNTFSSNRHELGPDALWLDDRDSLVFIHYSFSRQVAVYDVHTLGKTNLFPRLALIKTVEKEKLAPEVLLGKQIFNNAKDPRMNKDAYVSCGACHFDGDTDQRVWDFTDRGEGLRRTTSLWGKSGTKQGPLHWSANFDEIQDFEHDMRGPQRGTGFISDAVFNSGTHNQSLGAKKAGLSPDLDALSAYVNTLDTVRSSPFRDSQGRLTPEAQRGKTLFKSEKLACAQCHSGAHFTNSYLPTGPNDSFVRTEINRLRALGLPADSTPQGFLVHDVGTLSSRSGKRLNAEIKGIDTPSLKGLWTQSLFLHDGQSSSLNELFGSKNSGNLHGRTSHLSSTELDDLIAYLMQIDEREASPSNTGVVQRSLRASKAIHSSRYNALGKKLPEKNRFPISIHTIEFHKTNADITQPNTQ